MNKLKTYILASLFAMILAFGVSTANASEMCSNPNTTLAGTVYDINQSNTGVPFANVELRDASNNSVLATTVANAGGYFSFTGLNTCTYYSVLTTATTGYLLNQYGSLLTHTDNPFAGSISIFMTPDCGSNANQFGGTLTNTKFFANVFNISATPSANPQLGAAYNYQLKVRARSSSAWSMGVAACILYDVTDSTTTHTTSPNAANALSLNFTY